LNTGVSVFNGKDWKNYDVVDGPIGERIFDIEICPKDGDVWMATSAGLTRFRLSHDWEHYTREDGLLEDQASVLAFKKDGTLIVGTQCHGLAIFNRFAKGVYRHKRNITAPDRFGQNISPVPLVPSGNFFHSNLINDILVAQNAPDSKSQGIWIATSTGLIKTNNDLTKFEFWRGKDYVDKVRGLWGGVPKDFKPALKEVMDQLLPEDYLTALVEDGVGQIYVGMRQNGFLISDPVSGRRWFVTQKGSGLTDNFVTKIAILEDGNFLVGTYGGGVVKSTKPLNLTIHQPKKTE
jgi:ligand-binding sensor domain-containing protein